MKPVVTDEAIACPACKIIIDYGALQAAAANLEKSAYAAWEAVLAGVECGAFTWADVEPMAYSVCEWAEELRAKTAAMEKEIRELAERKPR